MKPGRLVVHSGTMFGGKTKSLIGIALRYPDVSAYIPSLDTRDEDNAVVTHNGYKFPALRIYDPFDIVREVKRDGSRIVIIDECHMFQSTLPEVVKILVNELGVDVYVSGLCTDYRGEVFMNTAIILAMAEEWHFHSASCVKCGAPAVYSKRITKEDDLIVPGGSESYEPRCRACFGK